MPKDGGDTVSAGDRQWDAANAGEPQLDAAQIRALDRAHVLHTWSTQSQIRPLVVAGGEGRRFWDCDGKRYLDFASLVVNANLGHQHPRIVAAVRAQAARLCATAPAMTDAARARLAGLLAEITPGDLTMSLFTNGGAEANENAIKLARWYTGRQDRRPLPLLSRRDGRRGRRGRRPAPLAGRARHPRRGTPVRPVSVPLLRRIPAREPADRGWPQAGRRRAGRP